MGDRLVRWTRALVVAAFVVYSIAIIRIELEHGQDRVRDFVTDIFGPGPLFAVNTTLSMTLLWATGFTFVIGYVLAEPGPGGDRRRWFCASQVVVFGVLGFDDRFLLHEDIILFGKDAVFHIVVGLCEVVLLWRLGELEKEPPAVRRYLGAGVAFFVVMAVIDTFAPGRATLRLSAEDLSKTWGALCMFMFGWSGLYHRLVVVRDQVGRASTG